MIKNMNKYSKVSKQDKKNIVRAFGYMSQIAITMAACVLIGVLVGMGLDNWLGTAPWMVIVFSLIGCISAFKAMIDIAKKF